MKNLLHISCDELSQRGVVEWGYTCESTPASYDKYRDWLKREKQGSLTYLTGKRAKMRSSLLNYYPDFQSAVVFLFDYSRQREKLEKFYQSEESNGLRVGSYAVGFAGRDYHRAIQERLSWVGERLKEKIEGLEYIFSLDVHPVLERDLAYRAGLGG